MTDTNVLDLRHITKSFGGVHALRSANLSVRRGEIHGLLGENGSGKSTIIKCLAGFHAPDSGSLTVRGEAVELPLPAGKARRLGLEFVHQDLGLLDGLSVAENLLMEEIAASRGSPLLRWRAARGRVQAALDAYGVRIRADRLIETLRPVEQAQVAIVRAVEGMRHVLEEHGHAGGLLVLDEPTVFLPDQDVRQLFSVIRRIAERGSAILLVSHNLREIRSVTDRVTVLRDGVTAGTLVTRDAEESEMVRLIVGNQAGAAQPSRIRSRRPAADDAGDAVVTGLAAGTAVDLSFSVASGEIVGITGLAGSGFEEVCSAVFGAGSATSGVLELGGASRQLARYRPPRAIKDGLAFLPADRGRLGSIPVLSLADNLMMPSLDEFTRAGVIDRRRVTRTAESVLQEFAVRAPDSQVLFADLSGGNQQKVLVAKWLRLAPRLLLLDEPTQGVDVGARAEISSMLRAEAKDHGIRILCASSDYEQLTDICDRVLVMQDGRLVAELTPPLTVPAVIQACYGQINIPTPASGGDLVVNDS
jgi:ribose transport system ATP-binding protein